MAGAESASPTSWWCLETYSPRSMAGLCPHKLMRFVKETWRLCLDCRSECRHLFTHFSNHSGMHIDFWAGNRVLEAGVKSCKTRVVFLSGPLWTLVDPDSPLRFSLVDLVILFYYVTLFRLCNTRGERMLPLHMHKLADSSTSDKELPRIRHIRQSLFLVGTRTLLAIAHTSCSRSEVACHRYRRTHPHLSNHPEVSWFISLTSNLQ